MAEETRAEYEARVAEELGDQYRKEGEDISSTAKDARDGERNDDGALETWDDYNAHVAAVPGVFGDIDTTAGAGAAGTDAISSKNELATVEVAQKDEAAQAGDEEAAAVSDDEARRQVEVQGPQPSAEEVEAAADDTDANTPEEADEQFASNDAAPADAAPQDDAAAADQNGEQTA